MLRFWDARAVITYNLSLITYPLFHLSLPLKISRFNESAFIRTGAYQKG